MSKLAIIGLIVMSSVVVGCGKGSTGGSSGWKKETVGGTPIELRKQNDSCITVFSSNEDVTFSITQFLDEYSQLVQVNFTGQIRENYVLSPTIAPITKMNYQTAINYEIEVSYDEYTGESKTLNDTGFVFKNVGKNLDVCPSIKAYESDTYETAGLNISHSITKTYNAINKVMPDLELKPINVYVAPKITVIKKIRPSDSKKSLSKEVMTDNAFYYHELDMISFLPESYEHKSIAPFWEIPMVGSHEYGHHVFYTIVGKNVEGGLKHSLGCFKNHNGIGLKQSKMNKLSSERDTSPRFTLGAINEGFADLISYYSMSDREASLKGVKCMEGTRDVGSSEFADGTEKTFSYTAQWRLDSSYAYSRSDNCEEPDYQEIHDVGALFAHVADKLISKVVDTKEQKLKIILGYAKAHAKKLDNLESLEPSEYLFNVLQLVYKSALLEVGVINPAANKKYCKDVKDNFEYFSSKDCLSL